MGNSQHPHLHSNPPTRPNHRKIFTQPTPQQPQHSQHPPAAENTSTKPSKIRRNQSLNNSIDKNQSQSKPKKYLSLSKQPIHNEHSILKDSKCPKGIIVTGNEENSLRMSVDRFIKFNNKPTEPTNKQCIKKMAIKPRDLPRYSSQKVIPAPASTVQIPITTANLQPRPSQTHIQSNTHLNQPNIIINYVVPNQQLYKNTTTSMNLNGTAYILKQPTNNNSSNWHPSVLNDSNVKKLRKVTMNRSYAKQDESTSIHSYEQQSESTRRKDSKVNNEEQEITGKVCSPPASKHIQYKQNQELFTDPNLLHYIKQNSHLKPFKETESKYALAYEENGSIVEQSINLEHLTWASSIVQEKYPYATDKQNLKQTLEGKVQREVQSKPLIEQKEVESKVLIEQPFRFQTATDISYEERSDNTSFIPMNNFGPKMDNESYEYYGDQFLRYCKPKINEKVLADLLRLPLKH